MLLSLRNDHKDHLSLLFNQPSQVHFCKLAIDFLQNGLNLNLYYSASQKLEVQSEDVQNCVFGLVNLLLESSKHKLNDVDFRDSVLTIGFTQEQQVILSKFYTSKGNDIADLLAKLTVEEPHYNDLYWRFEVQVASRSLLQQVTPLITMDLVLTEPAELSQNEETKKHMLLQTDPCNLLHVTNMLEEALIESTRGHCRRRMRQLKFF